MASILVLLQEHYPKDTRVRKELAALRESGHQIDIICLQDDNEPAYAVHNGVRIHRISIAKRRATTLRYIFEYVSFFVITYFRVRKFVRKNKVDIVHVHTIPDFLVFAAHPAKRRGAKVILDLHEIMPEFFSSKYHIGAKHILIKLITYIERISIEYADYVITVNRQLKNKFLQRTRPKNEITEIMNTVSEEVMPTVTKNANDKFIAIYHGTLTELYNISFAVRALKDIVEKLPDFEFHVYGGGPELEPLRELVRQLALEKKVFIQGKVSYEKIPGILAEASLGLLPIKKDVMSDMSFSNKLAEYVHNQIPVLSTSLVGVREYFPDDAIFYYDNDDAEKFQEQLLRIYNNAPERILYAKKAFECNKALSWDIMKIRLQRLVKTALSEE